MSSFDWNREKGVEEGEEGNRVRCSAQVLAYEMWLKWERLHAEEHLCRWRILKVKKKEKDKFERFFLSFKAACKAIHICRFRCGLHAWMFKRTSLKTAEIWRNTVHVSVICVGVAKYRHVWLQCTVHLVVTSNTRVTRARFKGPWVEGLWNSLTLLNSKEPSCCHVAVFNGHWKFHLIHVTNECHNDYHTKAAQITRKKNNW